MSSTNLDPYKILGVKQKDNDYELRKAYITHIHELKADRLKPFTSREIKPEQFRLICRAYETLSDYDKREHYDKTKQWASEIYLEKYTLQQLAAEPDLATELKSRLEKVTLREINAQDSLTGHTPLYCAARTCNTDGVTYLTEQGADPDLPQRTGSTALHVGAFYGHADVVRRLLENGADYRIQNAGEAMAEEEARGEDVKLVFDEMKKDPFVQAAANQIDWFKKNIHNITQHIDHQYYYQRQTLLHCACKKGYADLVIWLIETHKANLDIIDLNLNSALHLAAQKGSASIVQYLLEQGVNALLINKWGLSAEQEGMVHGKKITDLFQRMRQHDPFKMVTEDVYWWFKYHFDEKSPDVENADGATLLYVACRHGKKSIAKWLLDNGANVNRQLKGGSYSTPLHTAAFHEHLPIVELLLSYGADVNIKNKYGETVFENAKSDAIRGVLEKYRTNIRENKIITVNLYGDGLSYGNAPLAVLQLQRDANRNDLINAMPVQLRHKYNSFSMARRPLDFKTEDTTVLSAVCGARYGKTKFIELPLCITVHESPRYMHSGHVSSNEVPDFNLRQFQSKLQSECEVTTINVKAQKNQKQKFNMGSLVFTFGPNCISKDLSIDVRYIFFPDLNKFYLPECVCIFETNSLDKKNYLDDMPSISFENEPNARLYSWIKSSYYWVGQKTQSIPFIDGVHAMVRHVDVIPGALRLPPDMFIAAAVGKPLTTKQTPVYCRYLKVREHNDSKFPHIAYHGTSIEVIPSILMDGLVMPSTVVSSGFRVCPPTNHIARGVEAYGIKDFSNGIFVSPSIHYCSDPAYAVTFSDGDQRLIPVLVCSIKKGSYGVFASTVPGYVCHPSDNPKAMEWRLTNPADIEIISVLFIPVIKSRDEAARLRAGKLGVDPNAVV